MAKGINLHNSSAPPSSVAAGPENSMPLGGCQEINNILRDTYIRCFLPNNLKMGVREEV